MQLLGKAMTPEFWKEVREKDCWRRFREDLFDLWNKYCENRPIEALRYSDYKLFWVTGDRKIYEETYFARRHALNCSCLLALIYPEEEKYITRANDQIFAICDEYTWCLPAHQRLGHEIDRENPKLEDSLNTVDETVIDLFASETGFALAELGTLLGDRLEPLVRNRIAAEIDRRIVKPFLTYEPYSGWETGKSNWTAVCMGSVAGTIMHMRPELVEELQPRFDRAMEGYLSGFNDDGICLEGVGYWNYGFGFFAVYADMIRTFTNGKNDYFKREKVKAIATFIQKIFLSGKACVSFADGAREGSFAIGLHHYLKREYPDAVTLLDPQLSKNYDNCARCCTHIRSALWLDEALYEAETGAADDEIYYAQDSEWYIRKNAAYGFAAKGGCNAELHNHNDVGTFIFAKNGRQIITDLGSGAYTRQYFSSERYTFLETSSRGHNVPIIDGQYQENGPEAAAAATVGDEAGFVTDIAGAYDCAGLESIRRSFAFAAETVTLHDEFVYTGKGSIVERLISVEEPKEAEKGIIRIAEVEIRYDPARCTLEIHSEPTSKGGDCWMMDFTLADGVRSFACEIR